MLDIAKAFLRIDFYKQLKPGGDHDEKIYCRAFWSIYLYHRRIRVRFNSTKIAAKKIKKAAKFEAFYKYKFKFISKLSELLEKYNVAEYRKKANVKNNISKLITSHVGKDIFFKKVLIEKKRSNS